MSALTVKTPLAANHDEAVRCLFAIELSKTSWIAGYSTPLSDKLSRYTLKACDWKGLLELIERVRARVGNTKGRIKRIMIVALARKLLVALWRYLETGVVPQGAVLKG